MILYLDTSALVPLIIEEPSTRQCVTLWDAADRVFSHRIAYVETTAALGMAHRMQRIDDRDLGAGRSALDRLWGALDIVELGSELVGRAADLSIAHALRGYDAVHCAAAEQLANGQELVAAAGDARLLAAWRALGLNTADVVSDSSA